MTAATPPAVVLDGVAVARGGRAVWSDGTLEIPAGVCAAVIGPNGSGKTTLIELLLGLIPAAEGRVEVLGAPPARGDRRIGYVPQTGPASDGDPIRCRDLVTLGLSGTRWGLGRLRSRERREVERALDAVGATGYADARMSRVSGGQRQRVAVAQALVGSPELLLLDEPLAGLDVRNQAEVVDLLARLKSSGTVTILIVTHDLNPLLRVLDGAVYLLDGHPHYAALGDVVDRDLLTHLYGTEVRVVRTPQGDLFTRSG
jgi:zinc/manganese transport system ATP-binding protein